MEAGGAPSNPPASVSAPFYGIQSYGYTDQRKVETDVEVTEDRSGDLSLRKPRMLLSYGRPPLVFIIAFVFFSFFLFIADPHFIANSTLFWRMAVSFFVMFIQRLKYYFAWIIGKTHDSTIPVV